MSTLLMHATTADTQPKDAASPIHPRGGVWMVGCETCGWTKVGCYSGIVINEERALAMAHRAGTAHEEAMNGKVEGS